MTLSYIAQQSGGDGVDYPYAHKSCIKAPNTKRPSSRETSRTKPQKPPTIFGSCGLGASLELGSWTLGALAAMTGSAHSTPPSPTPIQYSYPLPRPSGFC